MQFANNMRRFAVLLALPMFGCADESNPTAPRATPSARAALVSDASSIALEYPMQKGYWWDHTDLTVAVRAAQNLDAAAVAAIRSAITTWNDFLDAEMEGLVTLTDVTGSTNASRADITLHYVGHAGGARFAGYAICVRGQCPNTLVSSHFAQSAPSSPELMHAITLHELGHTLGMFHAEPILTTSDLMGYGWYFSGTPYVMSACDVKALRAVFQWAIDGVDPHPPVVTEVQC
jgi:predicted Zn-dependent protease